MHASEPLHHDAELEKLRLRVASAHFETLFCLTKHILLNSAIFCYLSANSILLSCAILLFSVISFNFGVK